MYTMYTKLIGVDVKDIQTPMSYILGKRNKITVTYNSVEGFISNYWRVQYK